MSGYEWTNLALIPFGGGLAALVTALMLWPRRDDSAARLVQLFAAAIAAWGVLEGFEGAATTLECSMMWSRLSFLPIVLVSPLGFQFALDYGRQVTLPHKWLLAMAVVPALTLVMVWTNDLHHLHWVSTTLDPATHLVIYERGPYFWVFTIYTYALNAASLAILTANVVHSQRAYLGQHVAVLVGAMMPVLGNLAYLTGAVGLHDVDLLPASFGLTAVILTFSMRHQQLFDLRPVLRSRLLDVMDEAVLLLDEQGRIADYNQAMVRLIPAMEDSTGRSCAELWPQHVDLCAALNRPEESVSTLELDLGGQARVFDVRVRPLAYGSGRSRGHLAVLHDITAEQRLAKERDGLLADLRDAVASVQELGGLLPICANCKKIRDDQGFWHHVEAYIAEHAEVDLSLAICPDCQAKLAQDEPKPRSWVLQNKSSAETR